MCNYSRQFIENYADIARPLTSLLKKDEPFVWTKAQDTAMSQLKQCLCSAPCLAYPDPGKEFYLDAGFSDQCLSAGLYHLHDKDKRVVGYASKTLLPPECKYSPARKLCFALCGASSVSLITSVHRKSSSKLPPASDLPQQSTNQRWRGNQRT